MSTKVDIVVELVRGDNPLAPAPGSAKEAMVDEAMVDEFLQALLSDPTEAMSAPAEPPLDLFEDRIAAEEAELAELHARVQVGAQAQALAQAQAQALAQALAQAPAQAQALAQAQAQAQALAQAQAQALALALAEEDTRRAAATEMQPEPEPDPGDQHVPARNTERRAPRNVQERIRGLNAAEQQKVARMGEQAERVVLERIYGKYVWESLLRNPKLTPPEAARIARMGALPVPLIELIVSNRAWLTSPQVRRALLSNPRLKKEMLMTVLRASPKNELKLMPKQTAYPFAVRQAAEKMLK